MASDSTRSSSLRKQGPIRRVAAVRLLWTTRRYREAAEYGSRIAFAALTCPGRHGVCCPNSRFNFQTAKTVIASEAKQSIKRQERKSGLLRCARNDGALNPHTRSRLAARSAGAVHTTIRLRKQRAQGTPGARCTRSLVCSVLVAHECSHHRSTGTPGIPCAMVLTAYFVLSPVTGLVCHRYQRIWRAKTRSGRHASANLTPASGRQDHTTSPSASASLVCVRVIAHRPHRPALPSRRTLNAAASIASRALRP